jgi:hypothetical protein
VFLQAIFITETCNLLRAPTWQADFYIFAPLHSNDMSLLFCSIKSSIKHETSSQNRDTESNAFILDTIRSLSKKLTFA